MSDDWGGPYVCGAFFCRDANEADGHWNFNWLFDGVVTRGDPDASTMAWLVLLFSGGSYRGPVDLDVTVQVPKRNPQPLLERPTRMLFDGPAFGHKSIKQIWLPTGTEGTIWLDVLLNSRVVTRIPFVVEHRMVD